MKVKNKVRILILGLLFSLNSIAGISIEPLVGYDFGTELDVSGGKKYYGGGGLGYGGKLGFEKDKHGFSGGVDFLRSTVNMANNDVDKDITLDEWGVYLGFKLPVLFKFYGAYIFSASGDTEIESRNRNLSGSGWKLGIGSTIIPFIDMNLDYREISFDDIDYSSFMFSLSWPIHLFE